MNPNLAPLQILYEDNHLIAVYKLAGVLVQGGDSSDVRRTASPGTDTPVLMDMVKVYIKERDKKPGNVFLGLIHRLDRNVGGIVLFAKTSKGASRLSEQFREHTVEKIYHTYVQGTPSKKSVVLKNYLVHREQGNRTEVFDEEVAGSQYAELSYEIVEAPASTVRKSENAYTLLKIKLMTGRHHQIRAQLSHLGHPILGDVKYGSVKAFPDQHLALYATELSFNLATADAPSATPLRKTISIPVPEESW